VPTPERQTETGEVLAVEQSSNSDKGDVGNTIQVLAESKKQQREAPFKAPQMDAPMQYTVLLAEIPASRLILRMHTAQRNVACINQPRPSPPPSGVVRWGSLAP
jgi:hypothetical protein